MDFLLSSPISHFRFNCARILITIARSLAIASRQLRPNERLELDPGSVPSRGRRRAPGLADTSLCQRSEFARETRDRRCKRAPRGRDRQTDRRKSQSVLGCVTVVFRTGFVFRDQFGSCGILQQADKGTDARPFLRVRQCPAASVAIGVSS